MLIFFNSKRDKQDRAIFSAVEYGDWETVFAYLDQGYPINYPDPDTNLTLLDYADLQTNIRVINTLQQYGAIDRETLSKQKADLEISTITSQIQRTSLTNSSTPWSPQPSTKPILTPPVRPETKYIPVDTVTIQLNGMTLHPKTTNPQTLNGHTDKAVRNKK